MMRLNTFRQFNSDTRGAAAVEFALLLPIILVIYLCVVEFTQAFMVQRRVNHATSQIADITAQTGRVTTAELNGIMDVGQLIMSPFSGAPLRVKITSISLNSRNKGIVGWSHSRGLTADRPGDEIIVPAGLLEREGDSLILSQIVYAYDSPFDFAIPGFPDFLSGITTFRREFYLRPREVVAVSCTDCAR